MKDIVDIGIGNALLYLSKCQNTETFLLFLIIFHILKSFFMFGHFDLNFCLKKNKLEWPWILTLLWLLLSSRSLTELHIKREGVWCRFYKSNFKNKITTHTLIDVNTLMTRWVIGIIDITYFILDSRVFATSVEPCFFVTTANRLGLVFREFISHLHSFLPEDSTHKLCTVCLSVT